MKSLSTYMAVVGIVGVFAISGVAYAVTYDSCKDAKDSGENNNGTYDIQGLGNAYCDMETDGGGWLGVTPQMARDDFNGTLNLVDGSGNTSTGFDADRPYTVDGTGAHTAHYTFQLPFTVKEFFFKDYKAKSNAATDDSSDIYPSRFRQTVWDYAHEQSVGDISFGFVNESGPVTSFAREQGIDKLYATGDIAEWPSPTEQYMATSGGDNDFRISWGDEGTPSEGWFPWWMGMIMLRENVGTTSQALQVEVRDIDIQADNDVYFTVRVSGSPTDQDSKIQVEYENNEGGSCNGPWRDAYIQNSARATRDDSGGNPDVDNGNTYQIGSSSTTRVIADGSLNTVDFTWDAERDLGTDPTGLYCVKVRIQADSGEIDIDTYIVDFNNGSSQGLQPVITLPNNGQNITDNTPVVSGTGTRRDTIITVSGPNGQHCNAVVDSSLRWTCVMYPSLQLGRQQLCAVEREGSLKSNQVCIYVTLGNNNPAPLTPVAPVGYVSVVSPINGITITTNNPAIIGTGVAGNRIVVNAVGKTCNSTVLSSGGWTCTLVGLNPGTYSVTANQYRPSGVPNGVAVGSFVINTPVVVPPTNGGLCTQHITSYMKLGQYNDQQQVRKLQEYLNSREGGSLSVTGVFDVLTEQAVKRYQQKYSQDILAPWGMHAPSGYVFKTTINHINRQMCSGHIQCPVFTQYHKLGQSGGEISKIQNFLRQYGYYSGGITGYFDRATDIGIRAFQEEFRPMVLTPWNLPRPTGNWYKTSRKHANWLNGCYERVTLEGVGITF